MKKLFLILLTSVTFAQSPFWKMELMETTASTPSTPDIVTDLVALWQNGDTVDATGRGNDLSASGGFSVTASTLAGFDSVFTFDGVDGYLSRASTTDLQLGGTDFTISMWVSGLDDGSSGNEIFNKPEEYYLRVNDNPNLSFFGFTGFVNVSVPSPSYHCIMVIFDDGITSIYTDGVLSRSGVIEYYPASYNFYIGGDMALTFPRLNGSIAQLAIYKRALTQEQITYLYNGGDGRLITPVIP